METVNPSIFRAYDIRGVYPSEINEAVVAQILPAIFKKLVPDIGKSDKTIIVVGHDVRLSSPALYETVLSYVKKNYSAKQVTVHKAGLVTTPMLYFLCQKLKVDAGLMITASHNPKEFNGIKMVNKNMERVSGEEIKTALY
jgi:phosphomannomutase